MAVYDMQGGDQRVSGLSPVHLMALYGDGKVKRFAKKAVKYTPHYWAYKGAQAGARKIKRRLGEDRYGYAPRHLTSGEAVELLGAAKRKKAKAKKKAGFMTTLRKVGKVTSGFTTGAATVLGVPKPMLNILSKFDPTKKGQSVKKVTAALTPTGKPGAAPAPAVPFNMKNIDVKKVALIGGGALVGVIILKSLLSGGR